MNQRKWNTCPNSKMIWSILEHHEWMYTYLLNYEVNEEVLWLLVSQAAVFSWPPWPGSPPSLALHIFTAPAGTCPSRDGSCQSRMRHTEMCLLSVHILPLPLSHPPIFRSCPHPELDTGTTSLLSFTTEF